MAIVVKDRVQQTTTTTGTSDFVLSGSVSGFQDFSAIGNTNTTYYAAVDPNTGDWEVGVGTYSTTGPTLTRDTVFESSNSGAKVDFAAGAKNVFCTYPAERAIYEEPSGNTLIDGGPITVVGTGVSGYTTFTAALGEYYGDVNNYAQLYVQNLNDGSEASADFAAYNDLSDGETFFVDMGVSSSNASSSFYPILEPNSGYVISYGDGGSNKSKLFLGSGDGDTVLFAGGFDVANTAVTISGTDLSVAAEGDVSVGGDLAVTGAASFGSTVLLNQDPTVALQAATKQYVDNQVTAGLHLHEPVLVETTGNLTATYAQGGTTFDITDITGTDTVTTSASHGLSVGDQIWLYTSAGNGLSTNVAYFVHSVPAVNQLTLSLTFGGAQITGLTNASGLTYATRANSGVGATLTNAGTQEALTIDGVALSLTDRVMVRLQTTGYENGVYTVTTVGDGSTNWVLTRATDSNKVNPADPNGVGTGDYYYTQDGTINAGDSHVLTTEPNTMILGYTTLTFTQFSGSVAYTGGTNIDVTGQVISLTGTVAPTNGGTGVNTVTTGDLLYGSASNTWSKLAKGTAYKSLVMDGTGTNVEWNAVALNQSGAVSGALGATNGGTGQSSYSVGDILYSGVTNTLSKLSGNTTTTKKFLNQTGTGSASAAPSWDAVSAGDISGLGTMASQDANNVAITGGTISGVAISGASTIDSSVIGGTTPAAITGTTTTGTVVTGTTSVVAANGIFVNSATVNTNLTIAAGYNGLSSGPIAVDAGVVVTISSGSVWTVV